ncbi:hypothetical protein CGRA01v4_00929 [Colletotrichum graminicola]|nr:hypothetical protein CGRA01v4_00929 [Colletotrichum graminicola]
MSVNRWARIEGWRDGWLSRVGGAARRNRVPVLFVLSLSRSLLGGVVSCRHGAVALSCLSLSLWGELYNTSRCECARHSTPTHTHSTGAIKGNTRKREEGRKKKKKTRTVHLPTAGFPLSLYPRFRVSSPGPVQSSTIEKEEQKSLTHRHTHAHRHTSRPGEPGSGRLSEREREGRFVWNTLTQGWCTGRENIRRGRGGKRENRST